MSALFDHEAFGLVWRVPFQCPGLRAAHSGQEPDVVVREGRVPVHLDDAQLTDGPWEAAPGQCLIRSGGRAGRFLVTDGTITFQRSPTCDEAVAARLFTDRVLVAALQQRGFLVLHANAAADDGAVVVSGPSGTGKSTTLAALLERGHRMLADDICAITLDDGRNPIVPPGIAQLHLTEDSVIGLGLTFSDYSAQPWRRMKAVVPTTPEITASMTPLRSVTILAVADEVDAVTVTELSGQAKFDAILDCVYGPLFPEDHSTIFPVLAEIIRRIPVHVIQRPSRRWSLDEVVGLITA